MNLLEAWEDVARNRGATLTAALRDLNSVCGRNYTLTTLSSWRTGRTPIPAVAQSHMRRQVLVEVCGSHGITLDVAWELMAALEPPARMARR